MRVAEGEYHGIGIPIKLSRTPGAVRSAPRAKGADTREVLARLGYQAAAIDKLFSEGAAL